MTMLHFDDAPNGQPPTAAAVDDVPLRLAIAERQLTLAEEQARALFDAALEQWNMRRAWARAWRNHFAALARGDLAMAAAYEAEATALDGQAAAIVERWQAAQAGTLRQQQGLAALFPSAD